MLFLSFVLARSSSMPKRRLRMLPPAFCLQQLGMEHRMKSVVTVQSGVE
jgi:hypothetical protein